MKMLPLAIVSASLFYLAACTGDSGGQPASTDSSNTTADKPAASAAANSRSAEVKPVASASRSKTYSGFDIAGIYLGMSPEEVTAAMKAYDPSIVIKEDLISFNYNALAQRYKTDSFPQYMVGTVPGGTISLDVRFTYPPEPLTVVMVSRGHKQQVEPVSQALYVESLVEKYGTPAVDSGSMNTRNGVERVLEWPIGNGTVQCMPEGAGSTPPILDRIARRLPDVSPGSVETCISTLRYVLRGDPVLRANGVMFDVAAAAKAEFASREWIQSLIDEKSKAGDEKPKL